MFKEERTESKFNWNMLGNIQDGRPNLGSSMDVSVYRLMQFTLRDIIIKEFDVATANKIYYQAGKRAGEALYENAITKKDNINEFIVELQDVLAQLKIGILRIEKADLEKLNFTITISEDLDCSGLPICDEEICVYDEGFIDGLLSAVTGKKFKVKEVDCWCSGDRICRFEATVIK